MTRFSFYKLPKKHFISQIVIFTDDKKSDLNFLEK
jgi:hypothetical protein